MKKFKFLDKYIGENQKTFIIAEIGLNHNGKLSTCKKMIKSAKKAGADAVKLQISDPDESYYFGTNSYNTFLKYSLSEKQIIKINQYAKKNNILLFATAGDLKSLKLIKKLKFPILKISSGLLTNDPILIQASKLKIPIIISCGLAYEHEINRALGIIKKNKIKKIVLLKCTSLYPAPDNQLNIDAIETMKKRFNCIVGYSDHTQDNLACIAAVANGAKVIEKHFTLDKKQKGLDHFISADPDDLKDLINKVRITESMLGKQKINKKKIIKNKLKTVTRSIFYSENVKKGNKISLKNIKLIRPGSGLHPYNFEKIIGKKVKTDCKRGKPVRLKDILF